MTRDPNLHMTFRDGETEGVWTGQARTVRRIEKSRNYRKTKFFCNHGKIILGSQPSSPLTVVESQATAGHDANELSM